ncbi:hypothetical protein UR09_01740 [Candidatus Nitromaritima sp. SCGC AAA799-A02]|nr:hypothetical protein UR09_01740 [Candidatus Nitromaritima sp. SCGC AAA799-A02]
MGGELDFRDPVTRFLSDKSLSVPLSQVLLFAFLICLCMLLGRHKTGLLVSYSFVFYWGFVFNREYFVNILGQTTGGLYLYMTFGFLMFVLVVFALFKKA